MISDQRPTMERTATSEVVLPIPRDLESVGKKLTGGAGALEQLAREEAHAG